MTAPPVAQPSTADLLSLIQKLQAGIKSSGAAPIVPTVNPQSLASSVMQASPASFPTPQNGRGVEFNNLPFDVKQLIASKNGIQATTGPVHENPFMSVLHGIEHVGGEALGRTADVLSRPLYALASGTKNVIDAKIAALPANPTWQDFVKDMLTTGGPAEFKGFASGIEGKTKTDFSEIIQHQADLLKAKDKALPGDTNAQIVKSALANPGEGHVNPWLKGGLGFAADVALDPTTYLGVGLPGKVAKGADELKSVLAEVSKNAARVGVEAPDAMGKLAPLDAEMFARKALGKDVLPPPGQVVSRKALKLQPETVQHVIEGARPALLDYAEKSAKDIWDTAEAKAKIAVDADHATSPFPSQAAYDSALEKETRRLLGGKDVKAIAKDQLAEGTELLHANLHPKISKRVGLTVSGQHLASIPVGGLLDKAYNVRAGSKALTSSMHAFDRLFRNSAGVHPGINHIRLSKLGASDQVVLALNHSIKRAFEGVSPEDKSRALESWAQGLKNVKISSQNVPDLVSHISNEVKRIQSGVKSNFNDVGELNKFLSPRFQLKNVKKKKQLTDDWLEHNIRERLMSENGLKDPAEILRHIDMAHTKALANKSMFETIAEQLGHPIQQSAKIAGNQKSSDDFLTKELMRSHGYRRAQYKIPNKYEKYAPIKYTQHVAFDPETAHGVEALYRMLNDRKYAWNNEFTKQFDHVLQIWKGLVTKYNPGYHERNLYGEMFNNMLAGVKNPIRYRQAARVLRGRDKELFDGKPAWFGDTRADYRAANALHPEPSVAARGTGPVVLNRRVRLANGTVTNRITADQLWHLYVENGLKTGWITNEFNRGVTTGRNAVARVLHHMDSKTQHLTENVEDFTRMAHFIDAIDKGSARTLEESARMAAQDVRKFHFDYTDFTQFEKKIGARLFPFYKWTRKNIPLMLEMTLAKPGKVVIPLKAQRALSEVLGYQPNGALEPQGDYIIPDWLKKDMATPVGTLGGKNTSYLAPALPWEQAYEAIQSPKSTVGSMINPGAGLLFDWLTGKTPTGLNAQPGQIAAGQTPYSSLIYNLVKGGATGKTSNTTLAQFLTGLGLFENTPKRMQSEAKQEQQKAAAQRKKYEQQQGTVRSTNHPGMQ